MMSCAVTVSTNLLTSAMRCIDICSWVARMSEDETVRSEIYEYLLRIS